MIAHIRQKHKLTGWQYLAFGYLIVILIGSLLLSLPFSANNGLWTAYIDALFTSVSATCVTGLVVFDTVEQWSIFGQIVILLLIQIGGIGFMTLISLILMFFKKRIGIYERRVMQQSAGNFQLSGVVHMIRRILIGTAIIEGAGMILLSIAFCQDFGWKGLYYALFHSVSAFCNAGFDLLGSYSSLSNYASNPLVALTVCMLILLGGIGFVVWSDLINARFRYKKLMLHTRIVLIATAVLIIVPTALFVAFDYNHAFKGMDGGTTFLSALFAAISPRTAGFFTVDPSQFSEAGTILTIILMFVGGSSGSTAGGVKVTTVVIVFGALIAAIRNNQDINLGRRRVDFALTRQAIAIFTFYLIMILLATMIICAIEPYGVREIGFEVVSAICTVGLSFGITPSLSVVSKLLLMLLMYSGRVGVLTLALAIGEKHKNPPVNRPLEKIIVG